MTFSTVVQSSPVGLGVYGWTLDDVPVLPGEVGLRTVLKADVTNFTLSVMDEISF